MSKGAAAAVTGRYLVVEDDAILARALGRYLRAFGEVTIAGTCADAEQRLDRSLGYSGFVLDVMLPDRSGLEVLRSIRRRGSEAPVLVLTGRDEAEIIAEAQLHRACFLFKPAPEPNLRAFVEWTQRYHAAAHQRLVAAVQRMTARHNLTARQEQIVMLSASGVLRGDLAGHLGVSESTVKTLVRRMLKRMEHETLPHVIAALHREIFSS